MTLLLFEPLMAEIAHSGGRLTHDRRVPVRSQLPAEGISKCWEGEQGTFARLTVLILPRNR